jgi:glycerol uptake facilitator protein
MREARAAAEAIVSTERPAGIRPPRALLRGHLAQCCAAELCGTFILVLLGTGAVHAAVLTKAHSGLFQVAAVWGIAVAIAIHATAAVSGAHINPAMTAAFALVGGFPKSRVLPYWVSQTAGAFLASAVLYAMFGGFLADAETASGVPRGSPGSEATACCYGEYFPNPGLGLDPATIDNVSEGRAMLAEVVGTALLAFVVFALSEAANRNAPGSQLTPAFIGLTITGLISITAPLTQACFNPARDFGPRLFAWLAGWGSVAIPGPRGGFFTVYIAAPICGAVLGAAVFHYLMRPSYETKGGD